MVAEDSVFADPGAVLYGPLRFNSSETLLAVLLLKLFHEVNERFDPSDGKGVID